MARRATDMLDVFRSERGASSSGSARTKASAARSHEGGPSAKTGFQGWVLLPRQILLGSAMVLLLLVFTFVLGLSVGRRDGSDLPGGNAALSATNPRGPEVGLTYVQARVPLMDPARHVVNDPASLLEMLVRTRGVAADHIWIADDIQGQSLRVIIGPFRSADLAADFLRRRGLFTFKLGGVLAWKSPDYPVYSASQLPATRLPRR